MTLFETIIGWILIFGCPIGILLVFLTRYLRIRRRNQQIFKEWERSPASPPLKEYRVTIIEKQCYTEESGIKTPKHHRRFGIKVRTDKGRETWYAVEESIYRSIPEHAVGTIAIVGDRVYGFCKD